MTATEKAGRLPVPTPTLMFVAPGGSAAGGGLSEARASSGPRRLLTRVGEEASRDRG